MPVGLVIAVVLENVKPEDTEGVTKQDTDPDEVQFLADLEIAARDELVKSVREKAAAGGEIRHAVDNLFNAENRHNVPLAY